MRVPSRGQVWGQLAAVQYRKTRFFSYLRANRDPHPSQFPCARYRPMRTAAPDMRFVGAEAIYRNEIAVLRLRWYPTGILSIDVTTDFPVHHSAIGGYGRSKKLKTSCWKRR
jgi:hypothetical protein